jgi:hypothetical protein
MWSESCLWLRWVFLFRGSSLTDAYVIAHAMSLTPCSESNALARLIQIKTYFTMYPD